ncbi:MAG: hypothetical protein Q8S73_09735 [Deltaproteobacteria bacterium]|nr:hypothetical protein [Myxococcales bacterium]MDP3214373.1 hypothetical protein [Deltaproteobacteria bacterium]
MTSPDPQRTSQLVEGLLRWMNAPAVDAQLVALVRGLVAQLARRPPSELAPYAPQLLLALDNWHRVTGGDEVSAELAALPGLSPALPPERDLPAPSSVGPDPLLAVRAAGFAPFVAELFEALAHNAGLTLDAYRERAREEFELRGSTSEYRVVPFVESAEVYLRAVLVVREEALDRRREVSLRALRALGLDAPLGAEVSLRLPPGGRDDSWLGDAIVRAISPLGRSAFLHGVEDSDAIIRRLCATHAPSPDVELRPFAVHRYRRVVETVNDPETEVAFECVRDDSDCEIGDEIGMLDPEETLALVSAATAALMQGRSHVLHLHDSMQSLRRVEPLLA